MSRYVEDTLKRKFERRTYFSTLEVIDGLQRVSLLTAIFKKGEHIETSCVEICRLWLNSKGKSALTSKRNASSLCSPISSMLLKLIQSANAYISSDMPRYTLHIVNIIDRLNDLKE